jgi:hypothetical protein
VSPVTRFALNQEAPSAVLTRTACGNGSAKFADTERVWLCGIDPDALM